MKHLLERKAKFLDRNKAVKSAYLQIFKAAKQLLSSLTEQPLRQLLIREDKPNDERGKKLHELISPLVYLCLECDAEGDCHINYGYEQCARFEPYYPLTSAFIRLIYKHTMADATSVNIEDCVYTDWVLTDCAELFEYVGDRNKFHTVKRLSYKPIKILSNEVVAVV